MSEPTDREKELTKLTASWLNTLGAGAIAIGVFTPISQLLGADADASPRWAFIVSSLIYLAFGIALHIVGRVITDVRFDYDAA